MAAFVISVEQISTSFDSTTGATSNTINLSKGQDETKCVPFHSLRSTSGQTDWQHNICVGVEMIDNSGTPAVRVHRNAQATAGGLQVEIFVVEFGSNVTVQQGNVNITGTTASDTLTEIVTANSFAVFSQFMISGESSGSDDFEDAYIRASFGSTTSIDFDRFAAGPTDWTLYWYVVESDGTDFLTEYVQDIFADAETGPTNITLSNSVTLANAFVVATYEVDEAEDDPREGCCNVALTGTTTLTWYRNHGGTPVSGDGEIGVWVVRASSTELDVQRFATDVDGQLTTNQTITAVDLDKAVLIGSANVGTGHNIPPLNTTSGPNGVDSCHTLDITSTTNVALQRETDTTLSGSNNNVRFEVVEFDLQVTDFTITAEGGSYTWTGQAAGLEYHSAIDAGAGSYAWTGQSASLEYHTLLSAEAAAYSWSGQAAALIFDAVIAAEAGAYIWNGSDVEFLSGFIMTAEPGSYLWSGQNATLTYTGTLPSAISHEGMIVNLGRLMGQ